MKWNQRIRMFMKEDFMQCMADYLLPWFIRTVIVLTALIILMLLIVLISPGIHGWADLRSMTGQCFILGICGMCASALAFRIGCKRQYKRPAKGRHTLKEELTEKH